MTFERCLLVVGLVCACFAVLYGGFGLSASASTPTPLPTVTAFPTLTPYASATPWGTQSPTDTLIAPPEMRRGSGWIMVDRTENGVWCAPQGCAIDVSRSSYLLREADSSWEEATPVASVEPTVTPTPTLCEDGSDWCCYWDFAESDGGWEAYGGTWDGSAWVGWNFYDGSWMAIWEGYSSIGAGAEWVIEQVEVWGSGYPPQTWEDGLALSIAPLGGGGGQVFDYKDFSGYYGWSGAFPVDGGKEGKFRIDLRDDDTGGQMHSISAVYAAGSGPDPGLCDVMSSPPVTSSEEITQMQGGVRFVWGGEGTPDVVTPTDYLIRLDISGIADAEPFWFLPDSAGWLDGCTDGSPITSTFVEESYEFMSPSVQRYVFDLPTLLECGIALWSEIDMSEGEGSGTFVGAGPVRDEYMLEWEFSSDGGETWTDSPDDASGAPDPPWEIEPVFEQCFTFPGAWHVDTGPFTRTIDFGDMTSLEQREFCARVDGITFTDEFAVFNAPAAAAFISLLVAAALGIVRS